AERRGSAPQVYDHGVNLAGEHSDELSLRLLNLIVEAPYGPLSRHTQVVLYETNLEPATGELTLIPGFEEEPAFVPPHIVLELQCALDSQFCRLHQNTFDSAMRRRYSA